MTSTMANSTAVPVPQLGPQSASPLESEQIFAIANRNGIRKARAVALA